MRKRAGLFGILLAAGVTPTLLPVAAYAQAPAGAVRADPAFDAAKKAFDALPETDRRAIQDALIWTGDYKGVVDGGFGRATWSSIVAWARRVNAPADGTLDAKARAALIAEATKAKQFVGFAATRDERSGVSLSLPLKLLTKRTDTKTGARWASADGTLAVETLRSAEADGDLATLFDRQKDSKGARKVTYKVLRPDFFVISGENGATAFYTRMSRGDANGEAQARGFTMTWPKGVAADDSMAIAVANSFNGFPAPAAAAPNAAKPAAPQAAATPAPVAAPVRRAVLAATAVNLGGDAAVTAIGACDGAQIADRPAKLVRPESAGGLVRYAAPGLGGKPVAAPASAAARDGDAVIILYRTASGAGGSQLMATTGDVAETPAGLRVVAALDDTAAGGAVFDRTGALVGYVGARKAPAQIAGVTPRAAWPLIPAASPAATPPAPAASPREASMADIAERAAAGVLPVMCVR